MPRRGPVDPLAAQADLLPTAQSSRSGVEEIRRGRPDRRWHLLTSSTRESILVRMPYQF